MDEQGTGDFFRNRPQAVLLHVDEYERLIREAEQLPAPAPQTRARHGDRGRRRPTLTFVYLPKDR